ncbi:alpha/beta hydrolase [Streptosporangium amethystogenes]|uniref:alpha/beta hydrolase n=1 Tax=Streptosporangium amethystogenes TaxID=2002 RepID=UPI00069009A0|nr:alpha/beta hydrolase [Streptosporangium amethystogenes]
MSEQPVIVLVHGAFAESASWNRVTQRLHSNQFTAAASGGDEFRIDGAQFHHQSRADLDADEAALMTATRWPVIERALTDGPTTGAVPWHTTPSWSVHGDRDLGIPAEALRFMAERAGSRETREVAGASQPGAVTTVIMDATDH